LRLHRPGQLLPGPLAPGPLAGKTGHRLAVCCASRIKPPKIACRAIFYPANCQSSPTIVVFVAQSDAKTYKRDRLLSSPKAAGICNYLYMPVEPSMATGIFPGSGTSASILP
ncbi:MAG: hypothetical protein LBG22_05905, partial [Treponema sp.]|nr:hypothetical protein [Treponema sp.]